MLHTSPLSVVSFQRNKCAVLQAFNTSSLRCFTADDPDSFCVRYIGNKGVKMKHGLLLIALFMAATALTSGEYSYFMGNTTTHNPNTTTHNPNTTTHNPNTTTHNPNTTTHNPNTTTHHPNTTTHSPNTTTHSPNTTTHSPNTTTHNPNTTTHNPNTTTHNPNTTTPQPPTTAPPAPTPPTNMTKGSYNVTDAKGNICILADLGIGIRVNTSEVNDTFIVQPSKTTASGECSDKAANIILSFQEGQFTLKFKNDETKKKVYVELVEFDLKYAFKRGALGNYTGKNESLELFSTAPGHSYSCSAETVYMGKGVSLDLTNYRLQAFNIKNKVFGTTDLCKADQPDYRVPIAVGIILIILIVIVVIAYLISRKRRSNGYQSL